MPVPPPLITLLLSPRSEDRRQRAYIHVRAIAHRVDAKVTKDGPLPPFSYQKAMPKLCLALLSLGMTARRPPGPRLNRGKRGRAVPPSVIPPPAMGDTPRYRVNLVSDGFDVSRGAPT